jgi:hypothetical protein
LLYCTRARHSILTTVPTSIQVLCAPSQCCSSAPSRTVWMITSLFLLLVMSTRSWYLLARAPQRAGCAHYCPLVLTGRISSATLCLPHSLPTSGKTLQLARIVLVCTIGHLCLSRFAHPHLPLPTRCHAVGYSGLQLPEAVLVMERPNASLTSERCWWAALGPHHPVLFARTPLGGRDFLWLCQFACTGLEQIPSLSAS